MYINPEIKSLFDNIIRSLDKVEVWARRKPFETRDIPYRAMIKLNKKGLVLDNAPYQIVTPRNWGVYEDDGFYNIKVDIKELCALYRTHLEKLFPSRVLERTLASVQF